MTTKIEYAITIYKPHSLDTEEYSLYGIDRRRLLQTIKDCLEEELSFRVAVFGVRYKRYTLSELGSVHCLSKGDLVKIKNKKELLSEGLAENSPVLVYAGMTLPVKSIGNFSEPIIFVNKPDKRCFELALLDVDIEYVLKQVTEVG